MLNPPIERFSALSEEDQEAFRDVIGRFLSLYSFISQILNFVDTKMERDFIYCRLLEMLLPKKSTPRIDLGNEVTLTHLRHQKIFEGSAALEGGEGDVKAIFDGRGKAHDPEEERLSEIIRILNEQFGLQLDDKDKLLFDQFEETWLGDSDVLAQARNNDFDNFRLVFERLFLATVIDRMDANDEIFQRILDDAAFKDLLLEWYARQVFSKANKKS
jgi:type I restriction enzyme R subunit